MSSLHSLRDPKSLPLALSGVQSQAQDHRRLGRGRGILGVDMKNRPSNPNATVGLVSQSASTVSHQSEYVQRPDIEYEKKKQILDNYIPGLHRPGENYPELPTIKPKRSNPIPDSLISEYRSGRKNAVMVVHEYGSIVKTPVEFFEVAVKNKLTYSASFACECKVGNITYPQGVAKTKKDAKKEAAKNAFEDILLSYQNCDFCDDDGSANAADEDESVTDASVDTHGLGDKNPVMMLYEYCAKKSWKVSVQTDDKPSIDGFHCTFFINNQVASTAVALNKKDAKTKAGSEALRKLLDSDTPALNTHWDQIARLVRDHAERLLQTQFPKGGWNVLAGFVVKRFQDDIGEVVAIGTGDACLATFGPRAGQQDDIDDLHSMATNMSLRDAPGLPREDVPTDGKILFDAHAEVVARRALMKWFYQQIHVLYNTETSDKSVFEWNTATGRVRIKESVSIHMYISTAPCGDASAFAIDDSTIIRAEERQLIDNGIHTPTFDDPSSHGRLRIKCEMGLTSVPLDRVVVRPTFQQIKAGDQNLRTMSCSCKILKWNVLGLQGSLLSQFVEPIYMSSLTLGNKFKLGQLVRAICCRVPDSINDMLPECFALRHPFVGRVSVYAPSGQGESKNWSINWCAEDNLVEVVDALTGLSVPESPFRTNAGPNGRASRLCKFGFSFRFRQLCIKTENPQLINGFETYFARKAAAMGYNAAKLQLWKQLQFDGYGSWLSKPDEFELFQ